MARQTVKFDPPEPLFTLFDTTREDLPEVVVVNEALLSFRHIEIFPWHLSIELHYQEFADNEMPTEDESKRLFVIGDEIEDHILDGRTSHGSSNALFLARSTWRGIRELAFQVHDAKIADAEWQALLKSRKWTRHWSYRMDHDPEWSDAAYFFKLFPLAGGNDA